MRKREGMAGEIARMCHVAGDDLPSFRRRFLAALRRVVPVDAAFFAAADPDTLLFTYAIADEPLAVAGPLFLENEFGDVADVNRFADLARSPHPAATLDQATSGHRPASARFRELLAPLGLGDEMRVALRSGGTTWGFLCLHREGPTGFSAAEVAIVRQLAAHAGEAIRRIVACRLAHVEAPRVHLGAMVVAADGCVMAITDAATIALSEHEGLRVKLGEPLPLPLLGVVRRFEAFERGRLAQPPAPLRLLLREGALLEIHAARLRTSGDEGSIALMLAPAGPRARWSVHLAAFQLSPAQRRVAELVLQGRSTLQMVAELGIAEYTVQDHLKRVFQKLGVANRHELVTTILR